MPRRHDPTPPTPMDSQKKEVLGKNFTVRLPVDLIDEIKRKHAREVADGKVSTDELFQDWYAELLREALRRRSGRR